MNSQLHQDLHSDCGKFAEQFGSVGNFQMKRRNAGLARLFFYASESSSKQAVFKRFNRIHGNPALIRELKKNQFVENQTMSFCIAPILLRTNRIFWCACKRRALIFRQRREIFESFRRQRQQGFPTVA